MIFIVLDQASEWIDQMDIGEEFKSSTVDRVTENHSNERGELKKPRGLGE